MKNKEITVLAQEIHINRIYRLAERLNNPNFNMVEFDQFKNEAGHNYFAMAPKKWIDGVNAIGIISKTGKYYK